MSQFTFGVVRRWTCKRCGFVNEELSKSCQGKKVRVELIDSDWRPAGLDGYYDGTIANQNAVSLSCSQ